MAMFPNQHLGLSRHPTSSYWDEEITHLDNLDQTIDFEPWLDDNQRQDTY